MQAAAHLRWLYDRGYPSSASVKLVGDRHRLSREERQVLQRGVCSARDAERRRVRLLGPADLAHRTIAVDGHNVVLTIANYIAGVRVFEADDGLVRDIGILHGRLHDGQLMTRTLDLVVDAVAGIPAVSWHIVFDAPVSHSRDHATYLRWRLDREILGAVIPTDTRATAEVTVEVVASADRAIQEDPAEVIVTSDSALIDSCERPVFDLAHLILDRAFAADLDSFAGTDRGTTPSRPPGTAG